MCKNLPEHLYHIVDKNFIQAVDNLESLRIIRDKIGLEKYLSLYDAKLIHEEIDASGRPMKLYEYLEQKVKVKILEVVCPSTERLYHLFPPNQSAKTCYEAKASTFGKNENNFNPLIET